MTPDRDKVFDGSIPEIYDKLFVPLIFEPYAEDILHRLRSFAFSDVLEIAAGTGVLTRKLASGLPADVSIVASDLNPAMLEQAMAIGTARPVQWKQADAMQLPFADSSFDVVVCQFGAMFFPEKHVAFAEVRRVLRPSGTFIFNVWDKIEDNEFADIVTAALASVFPDDPPRFMARTPHGYHDVEIITQDLAISRFVNPAIETIAFRSKSINNEIPAIAYCQGSPLKNEIEARDPLRMREAIAVASDALGRQFGKENIDGKIQAHVVTVKK